MGDSILIVRPRRRSSAPGETFTGKPLCVCPDGMVPRDAEALKTDGGWYVRADSRESRLLDKVVADAEEAVSRGEAPGVRAIESHPRLQRLVRDFGGRIQWPQTVGGVA